MPTPPAFDALVRGFPSEYCRDVWYGKLEWFGYPRVKRSGDTVAHFDRIHERDRQTDRQTDTA